MKKVADMSTPELIKEAKNLWTSINVIDCFGASDVTRHLQLEQELEKRGYEAIETKGIAYERAGA